MSYILIPTSKIYLHEISFILNKTNQIENKNNLNDIFISESLYLYLNNIKEKINDFTKEWDFYKKITNPYEYIHTHILYKHFSVSKYKPLSRSFFKMIEIIGVFNIFTDDNPIKSFHLAEGPGGFIEAFNFYRKNKEDVYYGITLISENTNVPSWKKADNYIKNNSNIKIEYGKSKNGDLFDINNFEYFKENYENSMDFITADGGFDFSVDFNNQEELSYKLILVQVFYAITIQKLHGTFILKIFDIFKYKTVEIIYLLSIFYETIYIYKPCTSRIANSEKYLICKNFTNTDSNLYNKILNNFVEIFSKDSNYYSIFNFSLPKNFLYKIKEINAIYGQQQLENINSTLNIIREIYNLQTKVSNRNIFDIDSNDFFFKEINIENIIKNDYNFIDKKSFSSDDENNISNDSDNNVENDDNIDNKKNNTKIKVKIPCENSENLENIIHTDKLNNKLSIIKSINIQKSINWCNKYNIEINKSFNS
jgi:23S rRNA U2552 (ribose-2'-O)-methylase RlmE/FtsJ